MLELLKKELTLELRRKSVIAGLVLYLTSTIFICYLTLGLKQNLVTPPVWSALFWIVVLFTAVNSVAKSFMGEKTGSDIYLYSIASAEAIILSKILYNFLLCLLLSGMGFVLFTLLLQDPIQSTGLFALVLLLASFGFASSLTLLSAIASKAGNGNIVMPAMSFPVIISILLLVVKLTRNCIDDLDWIISQPDLIGLVALNCLVTAVSYLLFPYIWRT